jgi:hypothetical protein
MLFQETTANRLFVDHDNLVQLYSSSDVNPGSLTKKERLCKCKRCAMRCPDLHRQLTFVLLCVLKSVAVRLLMQGQNFHMLWAEKSLIQHESNI